MLGPQASVARSAHAKRRRRVRAMACAAAGVALCVSLATGCGRTTGARNLEVDPELATKVLEQFLTTWKDGGDPSGLTEARPPIHGSDDDWMRGAELVDYRIIEPAASDGANMHMLVELQVRPPRQRKATTLQVKYVVGTSPVATVFRQ